MPNTGDGPVIDMGLVHGQPWCKDGTRIVMGLEDMRPDDRKNQFEN